MSVNGITNAMQTYDTKNTTKAKAGDTTTKVKTGDTTSETKQRDTVGAAVVYEKSESSTKQNKVYHRDENTVDKLIAEAEKRSQSMRDLVQKMLLKQGQTFSDTTDIYALLREGKVEVDPETKAQAQQDVSEDGYWGVSKTSDRLVSFAKALSGSDTSKANEMIEAVKKGFEEATKSWGGDLPDITKRTIESAIKKLEDWRDGIDSSSTMSGAAASTFKNQAATSALQ